jgi:hypothetical protein
MHAGEPGPARLPPSAPLVVTESPAGTGHRPRGHTGMRKSFRPPVKARRERRWLVRSERDDESSEQDAILDLGHAEKQVASGGASA